MTYLFASGQGHNHVYHSGVDWDAVANTTLALQNNATLFANADAMELTAKDAVYYALSIVALVLFCISTRSHIPDERYRIVAAERTAQFLQRRERVARMKDPHYRQALVQQALVVKKIIQEKDGQLTLGDAQNENKEEDEDDLSSGGSHSSIDSTDENVSTCVICLEAFRIGDIVAWSRTPNNNNDMVCNHVFHNECIMAWLMHPHEMNDACPSCRAEIVHEQVDDGQEEEKQRKELLPEVPDPYATSSAFVIMHGLVSRVRRASYSLIGQSIDFQDNEEEEDIESGLSHPKPPPSPMRRVFSLEGGTIPNRRKSAESSLRRRPSGGSVRMLRNVPTLGKTPPGLSPVMLRRVVSDSGRPPPLPLARQESSSSLSLSGRCLPLRPRGASRYQRVTCDSSECSISEHSMSQGSLSDRCLLEDEEDIVMNKVLLRDSIGQSLSDPTDEEDTSIMEDEPC